MTRFAGLVEKLVHLVHQCGQQAENWPAGLLEAVRRHLDDEIRLPFEAVVHLVMFQLLAESTEARLQMLGRFTQQVEETALLNAACFAFCVCKERVSELERLMVDDLSIV